MRELPTGTVTFLFTDIEGSTRLLGELGDRYVDVLAEHRRLLRQAFAAHGGIEVDTQGDAFFVAFARASDAAAAARHGQAALTGGPIRIRIGLHTGEPVVTDEGYVGLDVHAAARIAAAAHGGQVLVSQTTRELLDGDLRDLGEHRLKDLTAPQRLYQLGTDDFPPLRTLHATNLPVQPTPFIGRERELADVIELVRARRLVTLTGAGGSGKTRLATQAAAELVEDFADGVVWIPLQALRAPELVAASIASAVGGGEDAARTIGGRRMLLLLDNFEHVMDAAVDVASLLAACRELSVLVTSREPLRLAAERELSVAPLLDRDAVALFLERAPRRATEEEAARICRRLDNLPLAIELAAANARVLDPPALLERLDSRLTLLTRGTRDAPARQRTLRATLVWSYDLLEEEEQRVFRELGVFAGGCTVDDAELVCAATFGTLASLVDKSLLRVERGRFEMLETMREFALELLDASGQRAALDRRHAQWMAERALGHKGSEPVADRDNWRAAVAWALEHEERELAATLIGNSEPWRVPQREQRPLTRMAVGLCSGRVDSALELNLLRTATWTALHTGDHSYALEAANRLLQVGVGIDPRNEVEGRHAVACALAATGDTEAALAMHERAVGLARRFDDQKQLHMALHGLGELERDRGNLRRARELLDESIGVARAAGAWHVFTLHGLGDLALEEGDAAASRRDYGEGLELAYASQSLRTAAHCLGGLAALAAAERRPRRAGILWGATEALCEHIGVALDPNAQQRYDRRLATVEPDAFARAVAAGRELELDAAVEYALSNVD